MLKSLKQTIRSFWIVKLFIKLLRQLLFSLRRQVNEIKTSEEEDVFFYNNSFFPDDSSDDDDDPWENAYLVHELITMNDFSNYDSDSECDYDSGCEYE